MKRFLAISLALLLMLQLLAGCGKDDPEETGPEEQVVQTEPPIEITWMTLPEDREITAQQYFVYDCEAGDFTVISSDKTERIYPASVTKLFTAYVVLLYLNPQESITAGDTLDLVNYGSSVAEIEKGDTLLVEELVEAMLLPSGNDAAYLLAAQAGRKLDGNPYEDSVTAISSFVKEMNRQAQILGLTDTHFANPDGIHSDDHYTSFEDAVMIGLLALEDPVIMKYASRSSDSKSLASGVKEWKNTNELIDSNSQYYCPYAIGLKTGQTPMAGSCLLSAFECRGRTLIIGVFGCPEEEDRFGDTLQLFNQAIAPEETEEEGD